MKKKQKKVRIKRNKKEPSTFPTELVREEYFKCPIWFADAPHFVEHLNKASDS